jgi:hypothetical protein
MLLRTSMLPASTDWPNSVALPSVGGSRPVSIFIVVDLPQPLEPKKPKISPRSIVKETWSTATKSPKRRVRPSASMAISDLPPGRGGMVRSTWPERFSSGSNATKHLSRSFVPVRSMSSAGVPVASTRPASMATIQSHCWASSI